MRLATPIDSAFDTELSMCRSKFEHIVKVTVITKQIQQVYHLYVGDAYGAKVNLEMLSVTVHC